MNNKTNTVLLNFQTAFEQKKPFVFYRKPNSNNVYQIIQQDDMLFFLDDFQQEGFVFAPFDTNVKSIFFPLDKSTFSKNNFEPNPFLNKVKNNLPNTFAKITHIDLVKKGIDFIKNNQTPKIVLSRKETIQTEKINVINTFENLLNKYPNAFVYAWHHPQVGLWLGATPETLIQTKNNVFKTMALAGTQVYKDTLDVKWSDKEVQEHQFVTDYISDNLSKMNINHNISDTYTAKAGNLIHLKVDISGRLSSKSQLSDLIKKLHPTPAVCGLPKDKAKEFILQNENYSRTFYTGFLGELNFKIDKRQQTNNRRNIENHAYRFNEIQTNLFVNLRCMQVENNQIHIYIGGGITKDSNPKKEYLETLEKAKVMKTVISDCSN